MKQLTHSYARYVAGTYKVYYLVSIMYIYILIIHKQPYHYSLQAHTVVYSRWCRISAINNHQQVNSGVKHKLTGCVGITTMLTSNASSKDLSVIHGFLLERKSLEQKHINHASSVHRFLFTFSKTPPRPAWLCSAGGDFHPRFTGVVNWTKSICQSVQLPKGPSNWSMKCQKHSGTIF